MPLDPVMRGSIPSMYAVAAAAALTDQVKTVVLGHPLEIQVPREVETILTNHVTQALSPQHLHTYEAAPLTADNITLKHPASLLPVPHKGRLQHDCIEVIQESGKTREDNQDTLANPGLILYVNGSSYHLNGQEWFDWSTQLYCNIHKRCFPRYQSPPCNGLGNHYAHS